MHSKWQGQSATSRWVAAARLLAIALAAVLVTALSGCAKNPGPAVAEADVAAPGQPVFQFHADGFWLNLHHFLYVLGRHQAGLPDASRRAVAGAPDEARTGLTDADAAARAAWQSALDYYATGPSLKDAVFDKVLVEGVGSLARFDDLERAPLDAAWAAALQTAAPVYRQHWWPQHRSANMRWVAQMVPQLREHANPVLTFLLKAWGERWPAAGYPIQVSAWSNWAGAYSTSGDLLVISSSDDALRGTSIGLEILFHEAMHQWDDAFHDALVAAAVAEDLRFPGGLSHALIFFTAGEAVRAAIPDHQPYAERFGIWQRRSGRFLPAIEAHWAPYLAGPALGEADARHEALRALVRHLKDTEAKR